ncbi:DUF4810 domain-containing protein [Photorhabdus laumondii subsp. laumondii]|uniref:Photorhabdus luminescens subsp. laumondii TTO1 complete genome segment 14/17 n=2 Tax=Photorhabdus laumondii subsp. laumondii TaxID=141679 RepID=Q7N0C5_PHOLL|nr:MULTISPECIES: DUF4810 domain-containing protein [Photorhabdus]AXG48872.1 DUF4810 domain-containing protein [Photorhabdus laumondii subsp. laumondii]KTL61572.1 hypothetical protein AA106_08495 [Photorhabdus laumondii subsp. laumondii]MCC8382509.1 DUF4810 domain-containing protein [Photorhabdus laumondii]MCC8411457.1 DUF4810 domain-containing protein [Photorhabdus laumondii]NDK94555.1 DUF4810 domain-containing protein [Photorhabdus laumondii subsp. laumondii]
MILMKKAGLLLAAMTLAGCVTQPKTIYEWDKYQPTIYQYYQQDKMGFEEQLQALQQVIERAKAKDKSVPPGLHAQIGLLYSKTGRVSEAFHQFEIEKKLFPESAPFMDFLLSKNKGTMQ